MLALTRMRPRSVLDSVAGGHAARGYA